MACCRPPPGRRWTPAPTDPQPSGRRRDRHRGARATAWPPARARRRDRPATVGRRWRRTGPGPRPGRRAPPVRPAPPAPTGRRQGRRRRAAARRPIPPCEPAARSRARRSPTRPAAPWPHGWVRSCRTAPSRPRRRSARAVPPVRRSSSSRSLGTPPRRGRRSARARSRSRRGSARVASTPFGPSLDRASWTSSVLRAGGQRRTRSASSGSRPWTYHAASTPPTAPKTCPVQDTPGLGSSPHRIPP